MRKCIILLAFVLLAGCQETGTLENQEFQNASAEPFTETKRAINKLYADKLIIGDEMYLELESQLDLYEKEGAGKDEISELRMKLEALKVVQNESIHEAETPGIRGLEQEISQIYASGSVVTQEHYSRMKADLDNFESNGEDEATIKSLREKLEQIHVAKPGPSQASSALDMVYQGLVNELEIIRGNGGETTIEGYTAMNAKIENLARSEYPAEKVRELNETFTSTVKKPYAECIHNRNPIFTRHITEIEKIHNIVTPPNLAGTDLKTHSYVETDKQLVPVYAPADMVLFTGAHYVGGPYWFEFRVTCEITLRFGHITDPIREIKELFPKTPSEDSRTQDIDREISFKAGDLIGYTAGTSAAGNWDFGVYDSASGNKYAESEKFGNSQVYTSAVCPYDYFTPELKTMYVSLYDGRGHQGLERDGESFCKK